MPFQLFRAKLLIVPNEKRDANQQAAKAVEKITGSEPVRGEDLVSGETLKRKFREAKKRFESDRDSVPPNN